MKRMLLALFLLFPMACSRGRPEVPILNYHSVGQGAGEFTVPPPLFEAELDWLADHGFHTASLHDLLESREGRRPLPSRPVILTFDDGKEDALRLVLPALQKRGMRGTFFIITGMVGRDGYLTWGDVRALARAGMEVGSHTVTHPRLADETAERVDAELRESRSRLEAELQQPIEALAYPYNSVRARIARAAAAAGYRVAVAGAVHGNANSMRLLRIPIDGRSPATQLEQLLR
jgi:peptidoglycan/xylan/chitin deacetylase (PgdA/CDA1 family)